MSWQLRRQGALCLNEKSKETVQSQKATIPEVKSVTEYGNSILLHESMKDIKPLLMKGFPYNWQEIYALSMLRVTGNVPLKRAESSWQKLYNVESLGPDLTPNGLSKMLHIVGMDRDGQELYNRLSVFILCSRKTL